jgi:hypothetical protein
MSDKISQAIPHSGRYGGRYKTYIRSKQVNLRFWAGQFARILRVLLSLTASHNRVNRKEQFQHEACHRFCKLQDIGCVAKLVSAAKVKSASLSTFSASNYTID